MNKVYGLFLEFSYIREDRTRVVVSYNLEQLEDGVHATWNEVVFYKRIYRNVNNNDIKEAIILDINTNTSEKILTGFVWNDINVWLSEDNQRNFSDAQRIAEETNG